MGRIERTRQALQDLDEIWDYIGRESPAAADRVVRAIESTAHKLADAPLIGQPWPEWAPGLRSFCALPYPYVLFYRPLDDGIRLMRILHGARDFPHLFSSREDLSES